MNIQEVYIDMRKKRALKDYAIYHVIARTNRRERIFISAEIKEMFVNTMRRAKRVHGFTIRNFCVMGNHVHLLIEPFKGENLSRIMQWILGVFARQYNRRFHLIGHVWYDRFKSFILSTFRRFAVTFNYITENPIKAGIASKFDEYPYCGATLLSKGLCNIVGPPDLLDLLFLPSHNLPYQLE
jgi:putative transposase